MPKAPEIIISGNVKARDYNQDVFQAHRRAYERVEGQEGMIGQEVVDLPDGTIVAVRVSGPAGKLEQVVIQGRE